MFIIEGGSGDDTKKVRGLIPDIYLFDEDILAVRNESFTEKKTYVHLV